MIPQATYSPDPQTDDITCTEADLVALLRAGDETAIAQLVDQWSPFMLRVARSFVDCPQSAEDVVQDAWLGMLSGLAKFEGRSSLRTWMFSILVNRARTCGAREARTLPQPPLAARDESAAGDWLASPGGEPARAWSSIDVASAVGGTRRARSTSTQSEETTAGGRSALDRAKAVSGEVSAGSGAGRCGRIDHEDGGHGISLSAGQH